MKDNTVVDESTKDENVIEEFELVPIITYIPYNTVKLTLTTKIYDEENDKFINAESVMNMSELHDAKIDGWEWEGENVKYVLTDKAKKELGLDEY